MRETTFLHSAPSKRLCGLCLFSLLAIQADLCHGLTYYNFGNHKYALTDVSGRVADARAEAILLGGDLVSINSAGEEAFLEATFSGLTDTQFWMGLYAQNDVWGNWAWYNGDPTGYFKWGNFGVQEPNNSAGGENNVILVLSLGVNGDYGWGDVNDNPGRSHRGIVELVPDTGGSFLLTSFSLLGLTLFGRWTKRQT